MSPRRRLIVLAALAAPLVLGGCGWEPLYADPQTTPAFAALRTIKVNPIPERAGQELEMGLRAAFNPTNEPAKQRYMLNVVLEKALYSTGIQSQGLGTRGEVHITARYQLLDIETKKPLQNGFVHSSDAFDIQANGYATVVAQNDAVLRDIVEIRREIVARLTLYMQGKDPASS